MPSQSPRGVSRLHQDHRHRLARTHANGTASVQSLWVTAIAPQMRINVHFAGVRILHVWIWRLLQGSIIRLSICPSQQGQRGHHDSQSALLLPHVLSNYSGQLNIWTQGAIEQQSSSSSALFFLSFLLACLSLFFTPFLNLIFSFSHSLPGPLSLWISPSLPRFYMEKHSWCSTRLQWNLVLIFSALNW